MKGAPCIELATLRSETTLYTLPQVPKGKKENPCISALPNFRQIRKEAPRKKGKAEQETVGKIQMEAEREITQAKQIQKGLTTDNPRTKWGERLPKITKSPSLQVRPPANFRKNDS